MVDPTKAIGAIQNVLSKSKQTPEIQKKDEGGVQSRVIKDEVSISTEALNAQQAEHSSSEIRRFLSEHDVNLGADLDYLERES